MLGLDTRPAAATDDLHDTVDYGSLVAAVKAAVENDPVDLIETLAQRIADVCLLDRRVEWARVTVHKPDAPIDATFSDVDADDHPPTQPDREDSTVTETPNPNIIDADTLTGEMRPIRRAVLALGSNLGERLANLQGAVNALADTPDVWVTGVSPVYETEPVDSPPTGPRTSSTPWCSSTPRWPRPGCWTARWPSRTPSAASAATVRNAPRTLDVDLIVVGDRRGDDEDLRLPHPRAAERAFVLQPWHDVEPDAELPDAGPDRRPAGEDRPQRHHAARRPRAPDPVTPTRTRPRRGAVGPGRLRPHLRTEP